MIKFGELYDSVNCEQWQRFWSNELASQPLLKGDIFNCKQCIVIKLRFGNSRKTGVTETYGNSPPFI